MNDERDPRAGEAAEAPPSVEQIAGMDSYLERLVAERRPAEEQPVLEEEVRARMLAAQLRLAREGVEAPAPAFLQRLEQQVAKAVAQESRPRSGTSLSRGRFLRRMATLAGGVGLGVAGAEGVSALQTPQRPSELVAAGNGRWYDVAAVDEVAPGGIKPFSAGGLLGYLMNDAGRLHAVSAICTHMGCRLKPAGSANEPAALACLCHGSTFTRAGAVASGLAPTSLPGITVRVQDGRVLALGTNDTV